MLEKFISQSGESRTAWADRIGISRSYLSDILNGHKIPSLAVAVRIEELTGGKVTAAMLARGNNGAGVAGDLVHATDPATAARAGEGNPVSHHSPELRHD
jgi:transcriptional regulator with XRE-family HTH domain